MSHLDEGKSNMDNKNLMKVFSAILESYYRAISGKETKEAEKILSKIRKKVLLHGIPEETSVYQPRKVSNDTFPKMEIEVPRIRNTEMTMRGRVWKVLLGINGIKQSEYLSLVKQRECKCYPKIRGDTGRTFATDVLFQQRVNEQRLVRVLNSFTHKFNKSYVQGMDVLAGGMLFVMPEIDAFAGISRLINECFPLYWITGETGPLVGAYAGAILVKDVLMESDVEVYRKLSGFHPHIYAFAAITSISGIAPPFTELLRLWDFIFCFGVHVNVLCVAAQIILQRDRILTTNGNKILSEVLAQRKWPRLDAKMVIEMTMQILPKVKKNTNLWRRILLHTVEKDLSERITRNHKNY